MTIGVAQWRAAAGILRARKSAAAFALAGRNRVPVSRGRLEVIEYLPREPASYAAARDYAIGSEDLRCEQYPGLKAWADTVGDLVEKAADLAATAKEACK